MDGIATAQTAIQVPVMDVQATPLDVPGFSSIGQEEHTLLVGDNKSTSAATSIGAGTARTRAIGHARHIVTCLLLHLNLVSIYIALLVVCLGHYEHRVTMGFTTFSTTVVPLLISTFQQVFGTVRTPSALPVYPC